MKYNLRNLLWHMKHKGLKDEAERITECKEQLYDAVEDNINFFTDYQGNHLCANANVFYSIPMSNFEHGLTLDKFIEIETKDPVLSKDQIQELKNCHKTLMEQYEQEKESANRYKQICKYSDYIRKENIKWGYAQYSCDVYIRKDIPIELTEHEIAKYTDGWNFCFGGTISRGTGTETEDVYKVTVYTD